MFLDHIPNRSRRIRVGIQLGTGLTRTSFSGGKTNAALQLGKFMSAESVK